MTKDLSQLNIEFILKSQARLTTAIDIAFHQIVRELMDELDMEEPEAWAMCGEWAFEELLDHAFSLGLKAEQFGPPGMKRLTATLVPEETDEWELYNNNILAVMATEPQPKD